MAKHRLYFQITARSRGRRQIIKPEYSRVSRSRERLEAITNRWITSRLPMPQDGRLAEAARVDWFAVYMETPGDHSTFEDEERIAKTLRLAASQVPDIMLLDLGLPDMEGIEVIRRQLLKQVWGPSSVEQHPYLRIFILNLRRKLEDDPTRPHYLITEPGVGYRLRG